MARGSSRYGKVMVDATAGAASTASVLQFVGDWSVTQPNPNFDDCTAMGDTQKQYVQGLQDNYDIAINGFANLGTTTFTQIADGQSRKTYIYPDFTNNVTTYWFGTVSYGGGVTGSTEVAIKTSLSGKTIGAGVWQVGV